MLNAGVILLHGNLRSHAAHQTHKIAENVQIGSLETPSSMNRDMALCDYFLFPELEEYLSGTRFSSTQ